jgi:hypothetical protein
MLVQERSVPAKHPGKRERSELVLQPRSFYILAGPSRGNCIDPDQAATKNHANCCCCWTHGVSVLTTDDYAARVNPSSEVEEEDPEVLERCRVGLTIRSLTQSTRDLALEWQLKQQDDSYYYYLNTASLFDDIYPLLTAPFLGRRRLRI